jgi:anti-sigma factor RsiW
MDPPDRRRGAASRAHASACPSVAQMDRYLDGRCTAAARDRIEAHVAVCEACRQLVARLARILTSP